MESSPPGCRSCEFIVRGIFRPENITSCVGRIRRCTNWRNYFEPATSGSGKTHCLETLNTCEYTFDICRAVLNSSISIQYLICTVDLALVDLLSLGVLSRKPSDTSTETDPTSSIRIAFSNVCRELLPEAIGLSDAFGFSDWELDRYVRSYQRPGEMHQLAH